MQDQDIALTAVDLSEYCPGQSDAEPAIPLEEALRPAEEKRAARKLAREQAFGLRALADMIEANPQLAERLRWSLNGIMVSTAAEPGDKVALLAEFMIAGSRAGAVVVKDGSTKHFRVLLNWGPVGLDVYTDRELVCERVVVGTEKVTKVAKDPDAVAALPDVEITETVEQVKWVCRPLLAATAPSTEDGA